jgi:hypothetical protein
MIDLNRHIDQWVGEGIITAEQAARMRNSLTGESPPERQPEGRIPIVTEILGYVGAALAIWAVMFLVSEFWVNLSDWAQASLFGALAIALFVGGTALLDSAEPAFERLSGVLWAGSVVAIGGALFIVLDAITGLSAPLTWTMIGFVGIVAGAPMLWRQETVMQHVVLFASVLMAIVSLIALGPDVEIFVYGFATWSVGLIWALVSRAGALQPSGSGMVLGVASMFVGAQMTAGGGDYVTFGVVLGLATAALLATAGVMLKEKLSIVLGGAGIFMFVPQAMFHFFGETFGGMFGLFLAGLALVGLAIWFGRHKEAL